MIINQNIKTKCKTQKIKSLVLRYQLDACIMLARYASVIHLPSQLTLRCFWGIPNPLNLLLNNDIKI